MILAPSQQRLMLPRDDIQQSDLVPSWDQDFVSYENWTRYIHYPRGWSKPIMPIANGILWRGEINMCSVTADQIFRPLRKVSGLQI